MNPSKDLKLLPHYFKKYAFCLLALTVLFALLPLVNLVSIHKDTGFIVVKSGILVSFLLLALTREKIENELTMRSRILSLAASFIMGVTTVIIEPFINLLIDGDFISTKGTAELLISMFIFYFLIYNISKSRHSRKAKQRQNELLKI